MQLEEGEALVAGHPPGSPEFARGLGILQRCAEAGMAAARLSLGQVYSQFHSLPDAPQQALLWYRRAAEGGEPQAYDRLADLHMIGRGVKPDDTEAFRLYSQTAARGYAYAQCNLAYMLSEGIGHAVDHAAALGWYLHAAAQGEPRAYFNLGNAFQHGLGAAANPEYAWAWMEAARRQAYPGSEAMLAEIAAKLEPQQTSAAKALAGRIEHNFQQLQAALESDPSVLSSAEDYRALVAKNFAALGVAAFSLDAAQRPPAPAVSAAVSPAPRRLSERPQVFTVDEFVSPGECAHLMTLADRNFRPAKTLTMDRLAQEHRHFTGSMAALQLDLCDALVRNVERRVGTAFGLPASHVEPLSVLRYQDGHRYAPHVDYFDAARLQENLSKGDRAGQRVASFLVYLRPAEAGGETHYLKLGKKVQGRERMALCHLNCLPSGEPDPDTLHTGEPVTRGEKWLARTTVREKPFY
ncbi:MAG TPA: 2OG-Fe(II) oxygenase [Gammaproteobacteria bacterium]